MDAREISDFPVRMGPRPGPREAFSLIRNEVGSKDHARTSGMMDAISVIKDRLREARLPGGTHSSLNAAVLAKFDTELATWRGRRRGFPEAAGNMAKGLFSPREADPGFVAISSSSP